MVLKYYKFSLFNCLFCMFLSFIFFIPYGFRFHEKEKVFDEGTITLVSTNKGGRKIKLKANERRYWLSCYGVEDICKWYNIGAEKNINNVRVLLNKEDETDFLNGVILEYHDGNNYYKNNRFKPKEDNLLFILASDSIFSFKLSLIFLLISIFLFFKKI
ncbi:hypothetical protein [Kingella potus]|uniref:hypothetical protein n=1 Tax=Kingella potus TaxID=265175 RepID=UPI0011C050D7|nr:hypothetical protein [Kingella potus]UOO99965.1 hypothetical protein LVJ84_07955 [Kingella potus]